MHIDDRALDEIRTNGFVVLEGFLSPDEVRAARAGMFDEFPEPDDYFAGPERYAHLVKHQFAGLRLGPYDSWPLTRMAFHPDLVDAAERFCGTADLQLYKMELWAKYSGAVDYDQAHHRDFGNHSLVVPRADGRWPQLTTFILLSDVTELDGPTKVIPRRIGDTYSVIPDRVEPGELHEHEVAVTGPAGTIFLYTTDVLHRASAITGTQRARFTLLTDYSARGNPWMGKMSWPGLANRPSFATLMVNASPRERDLFGFPPPGHEYWNEQTLGDVAARWPGIDLTPYR
jgi:Phytanoyl-CoA dioxygenase (PhyH)